MAKDKKGKLLNITDFLKKNPEMGKSMKEAKEYFSKLIAENEAMKSELMASHRILWAMVRTKGGKIAIPDIIMAQANDDANSISTNYDPKEKATVFMSESTKSKIIIP